MPSSGSFKKYKDNIIKGSQDENQAGKFPPGFCLGQKKKSAASLYQK
jgi:hypothetical protein